MIPFPSLLCLCGHAWPDHDTDNPPHPCSPQRCGCLWFRGRPATAERDTGDAA
jgi:hypothetical protein